MRTGVYFAICKIPITTFLIADLWRAPQRVSLAKWDQTPPQRSFAELSDAKSWGAKHYFSLDFVTSRAGCPLLTLATRRTHDNWRHETKMTFISRRLSRELDRHDELELEA